MPFTVESSSSETFRVWLPSGSSVGKCSGSAPLVDVTTPLICAASPLPAAASVAPATAPAAAPRR
eukprot:363014-Prymnesium_polylepis.1